MTIEKDNAALDIRYAEWFDAFIKNSNENERQSEFTALLLSSLKDQVSDVFVTNLENPPVFVDLMCGPGEMTRHYKTALQNIGVEDVRAVGVELREDHVESWKEMLDLEDTILQGDVADKNLNINQSLGLSEEGQEPIAIFWGHGGYYLYQPKEGQEKGSRAELIEQPALSNVTTLIHETLGASGIAISMHKGTEWTDIIKERFSKLVESHTTEALHYAYEQQEIEHEAITFECDLHIPEFTSEVYSRLTVECIEEYEAMEAGLAKTARQILEFLVHTPLEELGRCLFESIKGSTQSYERFLSLYPSGDMPITKLQHDEIQNGCLSFSKFNQYKRDEYVDYMIALRSRGNGVIQTYVTLDVSVSPEATDKFRESVLSTVRALNQQVGKAIDKSEFLKVKREVESHILGIGQLAMEQIRRGAGQPQPESHSFDNAMIFS